MARGGSRVRITKGRVKTKHVKMVQEMYEEVRDKFGFIDMDLVTDMWKLLENPESVIKQPVIFKRTLKEYRAGKLNDIFDAYYARSAWARFLKMMAKSPHYPKDINQSEDFFKKMWELLGELWKKDIPQMKDIAKRALEKAQKGRSKRAQRSRNQAAVDQMAKLVDYGQKVLELLQDPLFKNLFAPPPPPKPDKKDGEQDGQSQGQGEDEGAEDAESPGASNSSGEDAEGEGDGSESGGVGQGTESSLGQVINEMRTWQPMMVEGVLFSQDLNMVTKMNPKGKWEPTPFPDNSVDVRKMQDTSDLMRLLPSQHAMPSDLFYLKFAKKELLCREFMSKKERRQILYVLLDVSGSMRGTKVMMVASVVLALLRKVIKNGDHYFLRFFDERTSELHEASDLKSAQKLAVEVVRNAFSGGGTNIHHALMTALADIKEATKDRKRKAQMKDAQVLLLTDGLDWTLDAEAIIKEKEEIQIHSVVIHASDPTGKIKKLSDSYYEVSEGDEENTALDLVKIFDKKEQKKKKRTGARI